MTRFGYSKEGYRGPLLVSVGWLARFAIGIMLLGTIFGTWFGIWASGPAPRELKAHGLPVLSTWAERPSDARAERVERPGSPARMSLHLPGRTLSATASRKKGRERE